MAHRCIHRVHFSTGSDRKGCLIPKSASTKTAADKFDAYVSMFTMNYPSLSVLKCIRHFLRSLFWFSRHYAMAVSGYRYGRISRHVSRKAWLCKGSKILPFLLILHQTQNKFLCFHFRFLICPAEPHSMNVLE